MAEQLKTRLDSLISISNQFMDYATAADIDLLSMDNKRKNVDPGSEEYTLLTTKMQEIKAKKEKDEEYIVLISSMIKEELAVKIERSIN